MRLWWSLCRMLQYRHLIPAPVDRTFANALLYKQPWMTCQENKPSTSMAHVAFESKLRSVLGHTCIHAKGNCVAFGRVVVYTAWDAHIFSAGIKCWHCSLLRADDVRLKGSPIASRFCTSCDLAVEDDMQHLIMQCPKWQTERTSFLTEISSIADGSGQTLLESQCHLVYVFMGIQATDLTFEQMVVIWTISAKHISNMYNSKIKEGVG